MIEGDLKAAIAASPLRDLPPELIAKLTADARTASIPAGTVLHREGDSEPHLELVVRGLLRVRVAAEDGRTMTVRYCRRGALIGTAALYAAGAEGRFAIQALSGSQLLRLRPPVVRGLADRDVLVARALLAETSDRVLSFVTELSGSAFATVRQRLARHLLDLASERQRGTELIAPLTQQELADAIGTVREVVVRVLWQLREEGIVETRREGIVIRDPERLFGSGDAGGGT